MKRVGALLLGALTVATTAASLGACSGSDVAPAPSKGTPAVEAPSQPAVAEQAGATLALPLPTRTSSALVRSIKSDALYLADEDHDSLRVIPLPLDVETPPITLPVAGHPASVLALRDRVVVAVRDPGFVLSLVPTPTGLVELGRVAVPADAWGMAVSADEKTLLVSSAWDGKVSAIDLPTMRVRWSVPVAREPRGIAITSTGVAYVNHLVGRELTRISGLDKNAPIVARVDLPPSPVRATRGNKMDASLGYALTLNADESELYVARHALGAQGFRTWFGEPTVDVLLTADDTPLAPKRTWTPTIENGFSDQAVQTNLFDTDGAVPLSADGFTQPRAAVYRKSTDTIVVASEGLNQIVELDATAVDPSLVQLRTYPIAAYEQRRFEDPHLVVRGGAPSAIALSEDEEEAYVYARSTNDIVHVELQGGARAEGKQTPTAFIHIADGLLSSEAEQGRRLYYDATDSIISGGLGCAGCHPDGRDDGFVWSETPGGFRDGPRGVRNGDPIQGFARQTPMLAGRVGQKGAYGWHGESSSLEARIHEGFSLHTWFGGSPFEIDKARANDIAAYLRTGLVEPPQENRPLTDEEQLGKKVFESEETRCATCHVPSLGFTDRSVVALDRDPEVAGYAHEDNRKFKTPSLRFVSHTAPYFHDGAVKTLEEIVNDNDDSMGHTSQLDNRQRKALVAYLRTL